MRLHVLGMAHTMTTKAYSSCAYTQKIRGFCRMMMDHGYEVFLYAGEENDAPCTQHFICITREEQQRFIGKHYLKAEHRPDAQHWITFNGRVCGALAPHARKGDVLCVIFGMAHKPIADAFPVLRPVEYGVGYHHTFAENRVFESYAWMHTMYGKEKGSDRDGVWFDDVIHGYLDPADFPLGEWSKRKDYLLYLGRIISRKGVSIAAEVAKATGKHLLVAGTGEDPPPGCEYRGEVGYEDRAKLLSQAYAVFCPTQYIEPFGNVAIEAQACGTPVITTDWGAFTETVVDGITGFRCRSHQEFIDAVHMAGTLDPAQIRAICLDRYSLEVIGKKYDRYFKRLKQLWGKGYYQLREEPNAVEARADPTAP